MIQYDPKSMFLPDYSAYTKFIESYDPSTMSYPQFRAQQLAWENFLNGNGGRPPAEYAGRVDPAWNTSMNPQANETPAGGGWTPSNNEPYPGTVGGGWTPSNNEPYPGTVGGATQGSGAPQGSVPYGSQMPPPPSNVSAMGNTIASQSEIDQMRAEAEARKAQYWADNPDKLANYDGSTHILNQIKDAKSRAGWSNASSDMAYRKAMNIANRATYAGGNISTADLQWLYDNSHRFYDRMRSDPNARYLQIVYDNMSQGKYPNWTPQDKTPVTQQQDTYQDALAGAGDVWRNHIRGRNRGGMDPYPGGTGVTDGGENPGDGIIGGGDTGGGGDVGGGGPGLEVDPNVVDAGNPQTNDPFNIPINYTKEVDDLARVFMGNRGGGSGVATQGGLGYDTGGSTQPVAMVNEYTGPASGGGGQFKGDIYQPPPGSGNFNPQQPSMYQYPSQPIQNSAQSMPAPPQNGQQTVRVELQPIPPKVGGNYNAMPIPPMPNVTGQYGKPANAPVTVAGGMNSTQPTAFKY